MGNIMFDYVTVRDFFVFRLTIFHEIKLRYFLQLAKLQWHYIDFYCLEAMR